MILLWGAPADDPLAAVWRVLRGEGAAVAFLDQRAVLDTEVELSVGATVGGCLRMDRDEIDLAEVTAVYLRPYESLRIPAVQREGAGSAAAVHALSVEDVLTSWLDLTPALVLNRPSAMASNTSKPFQAVLIREHGFDTPATLVTTDPSAALDFVAEHGEVIYKSVSSTRSIVCRVRAEERDRLADLGWCPTQFQRRVEGRDYRVHVVGDEVFGCEIDAAADDYRYAALDGPAAAMRSWDPPAEIAGRCCRLASALELPVAGIDLRLTPEGSWCCFEVNPAPGFTYFQEATDQPIDRAIARLLMAAER